VSGRGPSNDDDDAIRPDLPTFAALQILRSARHPNILRFEAAHHPQHAQGKIRLGAKRRLGRVGDDGVHRQRVAVGDNGVSVFNLGRDGGDRRAKRRHSHLHATVWKLEFSQLGGLDPVDVAVRIYVHASSSAVFPLVIILRCAFVIGKSTAANPQQFQATAHWRPEPVNAVHANIYYGYAFSDCCF